MKVSGVYYIEAYYLVLALRATVCLFSQVAGANTCRNYRWYYTPHPRAEMFCVNHYFFIT